MPDVTKPRVILAGGTGFLGSSLLPALQPEYEVVTLSRRASGRPNVVQWNPDRPDDWSADALAALDGAHAIVNYVGRTVDCVKTPRHKREILESRVNSVKTLAAGCAKVANPPKVWVQSATAHVYGDTWNEILDESSPLGTVGMAPEVGKAWEAALNAAKIPCRKVILRISFVLGRNGGPLRTLARIAKLFMGGTVGSGRQYMSWIHIDDLNAIVLRAMHDETMQGVYVVTAPNPKTNTDFMRELRKAMHRPWSPPVPAALVRIGAFFMRTDPELALLGRRCVPTRLLKEGFTFRFPHLRDALKDLL